MLPSVWHHVLLRNGPIKELRRDPSAQRSVANEDDSNEAVIIVCYLYVACMPLSCLFVWCKKIFCAAVTIFMVKIVFLEKLANLIVCDCSCLGFVLSFFVNSSSKSTASTATIDSNAVYSFISGYSNQALAIVIKFPYYSYDGWHTNAPFSVRLRCGLCDRVLSTETKLVSRWPANIYCISSNVDM